MRAIQWKKKLNNAPYAQSFIILLLVVAYFIFHLYRGERGLYAKEHLKEEIKLLEIKYNNLTEKRKDLERDIRNLGGFGENVDSDTLSEHLHSLGYARKDEIYFME